MPKSELLQAPAAVTGITQWKPVSNAQSRVEAGSVFVTSWLRTRYAEVSEPESRGETRQWQVKRGERMGPFEIRAAELALAQSYAQLAEWLCLIAEDAAGSPPVAPGHYYVGEHGESGVRGMTHIEFEAYGQVVRCERHAGPEGNAWAVSVDGVHFGLPFAASPDDARDDVAQRALLLLCDRKAVRVPDQPWQWSVRDSEGHEWWARVARSHESGGSVHELVLRLRTGGEERCFPWPEDRRPPLSADIRQALADAGGHEGHGQPSAGPPSG